MNWMSWGSFPENSRLNIFRVSLHLKLRIISTYYNDLRYSAMDFLSGSGD